MFIGGLSYPAEVLEWCTTYLPTQEYEESANPFSVGAVSTRVCNGETDFFTPRVEKTFVDTFRRSSPYINAHQGLIFVIHIPGAVVEESRFLSIMEDIALMRVVGIKLVLVIGPQMQVDRRLRQENIDTKFIEGIRVTDLKTLQIVKELAGSMRFEVESALSTGVVNMPSASRISVVSGSFYSTKPVGIIDGQDFGYSGKVRRIDVDSIKRRLDQGDIVILPNIGSSPSGQIFNCKSEEVTAACATALQAEKLIYMGNGETLFDKTTQHTISNLTLKSATRFLRLRSEELPSHFKLALQYAVGALGNGVRRAHILNRHLDGVLLMEIFHRDGVGLMISRDLYEGFRQATMKDLRGLKEIIAPLEDAGILKERTRTTLEQAIDEFVVIERDGMIIAGVSLAKMKDDPTWAELGCLAVHQEYRKLGKGDAMLGFIERKAFDTGVRNLFILSTQSFDWFRERGFSEVSIDDLPESRRKTYDTSRNSKIFHKVLTGSRAVGFRSIAREDASRL